jgi:hypothetical protein
MEKNIWLLPTDKPSRLYKHNELGFKLLAPAEHEIGAYNGSNQNIYITNTEKPKGGEYAIHKLFGVGKIVNIDEEDCFVTLKTKPTDGSVTTPWKRNIPDIKKIVFTDNTDLISNGIQEISEDFLQWFVKNPSCEYVEVKKVEHLTNMPYRTILPQEETKQDLEKEIFELEQELDIPSHLKFHNSKKEPNFYEKLKEYFNTTPREKVLEDWKKSANLDNVGPTIDEFIENSNEERLKKAAEDSKNYTKETNGYPKMQAFIDGAESDAARDYWYEKFNEQDKKMYSEEDMKQFAWECVANFLSNNDNKIEIALTEVIIDRNNKQFEQIKNK